MNLIMATRMNDGMNEWNKQSMEKAKKQVEREFPETK
jgi:hypothetical protein